MDLENSTPDSVPDSDMNQPQPTAAQPSAPLLPLIEDYEPSEAESVGEVTRLLTAGDKDSDEVSNELFPLVYDEMRRLARAMMNRQSPGHSLQPTDLVHNVFVKLANAEHPNWENKKHFMAVAARAMRSILVDHARAKQRKKRKAGDKRVPMDDWVEDFQRNEIGMDLIALNEYLASLESKDPRAAQVLEMRFFGGFSMEEIAAALGISERTIDRDWKFARVWIKALADGESSD
jgi:RNA polymerase sigma-70 factor, ECF subfamily